MIETDDIMNVLRGIDDPEMPISIVDLGIVESVDVDGADGCVSIDILPTFVGCPALDMIRNLVTERVGAMRGVGSVRVTFRHAPAWTPDRITDTGRASLAAHGVTVPQRCDDQSAGGVEPLVELNVPVECPYCQSRDTYQDSLFGPTRCRAIHYCNACRNSFEHIKAL
jgi:ring-1,2-phenylacetyl-CoA epoxidase subunit PaaD